jgi:hypothetical protein
VYPAVRNVDDMKDYFVELAIAVGICTSFYLSMRILEIWWGPFDRFSVGMFAGLMAQSVIKNRQMNKLLRIVEELKGEIE